MGKYNLSVLITFGLIALVLGGCVERKLTINTNPQEALVILNDEEIGTSPVTVSFEWYGDYGVRIQKQGYETLQTHRQLKAPWYDKFPFDFFAGVLNPRRIVDSYEWTFELSPYQPPAREDLIDAAHKFQGQAITEFQKPQKSK
ncbi:MAG: PEGA domain-containing protein [Planctomycetes bacterium]|nr:PEGA domain-containing protein [Planctomycetota bacterium]